LSTLNKALEFLRKVT